MVKEKLIFINIRKRPKFYYACNKIKKLSKHIFINFVFVFDIMNDFSFLFLFLFCNLYIFSSYY